LGRRSGAPERLPSLTFQADGGSINAAGVPAEEDTEHYLPWWWTRDKFNHWNTESRRQLLYSQLSQLFFRRSWVWRGHGPFPPLDRPLPPAPGGKDCEALSQPANKRTTLPRPFPQVSWRCRFYPSVQCNMIFNCEVVHEVQRRKVQYYAKTALIWGHVPRTWTWPDAITRVQCTGIQCIAPAEKCLDQLGLSTYKSWQHVIVHGTLILLPPPASAIFLYSSTFVACVFYGVTHQAHSALRGPARSVGSV